MSRTISANVFIHTIIVHHVWYNVGMTFEYPIFPDRTYSIEVDGQKFYITGENLIALALDKLNES
jgi:hypothetical protein